MTDKSLSLLLSLSALTGVTLPVTGIACGPFFPPSYLAVAETGNYGGDTWQAAWNPIAELKVMGEHFYPEWQNVNLQHNTLKSADGHKLDFASAGRQAGTSEAQIAEAYAQYEKFAQLVALNPQSPFDIPTDYQEFYLYTLGREQLKANQGLDFPDAWQQLLALAPEKRHYRTIWVYFGEALRANDYQECDRNLRLLHEAVQAGFADTLALEESLMRQLLRRAPDNPDTLRYLPLILVTRSVDDPYHRQVINDFLRIKQRMRTRPETDFERLMSDPVGRMVLLVLRPDLTPKIKESLKNNSNQSVMNADRLAWYAFNRGDFDSCQELLNLASDDSLLKLYLQSRLARMANDPALAAQYLRRWLELCSAGESIPGGLEVVKNSIFSDEVPFSHFVQGELGMLEVTQQDFAEALYAFAQADSWPDMAWVAERCLSLEQLKAFVKAHPNLPYHNELSYLLARRLMREYHAQEAGEFLPESQQQAYKAYCQLQIEANNQTLSNDQRSLALLNLAGIVSRNGMELFGTELEPDNYINNGSYAISGLPELKYLSRVKVPAKRFHYRTKAAAFAWRAALLATDPELKNAALIGGAAIHQASNPEEQEAFFWALQDQQSDWLKQTDGSTSKWLPTNLHQAWSSLSFPTDLDSLKKNLTPQRNIP